MGYAIAAPDLINGIRQVHDFLTVGAAAPLQEAGVYALGLPAGYYENLQREYQKRRDYLLGVLEEAGFKCFKPDGAYYIMTDISDFGFEDDLRFTAIWCRTSAWPSFPAAVSTAGPSWARNRCDFVTANGMKPRSGRPKITKASVKRRAKQYRARKQAVDRWDGRRLRARYCLCAVMFQKFSNFA